MKSLISLLFFILITVSAGAQKKIDPPVPGVKVYMNAKMEPCKKKQAVFFRKAEQDGDKGWLVMVYFNSGELKMRGHYLDDALEMPHGTFTYYYQNGQKESEGDFEKGAKIGVWKRWNPNGSPKAERFYSGYKYGDEPVLDPEEMPQFKGGPEAMKKYLSANLNYPEVARESKMEGEVMVTFVVNKVGEVEKATIMNGIDQHFDAEAIRVVESMPKWIPGKKDGTLVNTQMVLPIKFRL